MGTRFNLIQKNKISTDEKNSNIFYPDIWLSRDGPGLPLVAI